MTLTSPASSSTVAQRQVVALIVPIVLFDLGLQVARFVARYSSLVLPGAPLGSLEWLGLLASPLCFHLGLGMLCGGLVLACAGTPFLGRGAVVLSQALGLLTLAGEAAAFSLFLHTNGTLRFSQVRYWLERPGDLRVVSDIIQGTEWLTLAVFALAVLLGPWFVARRHPEGAPEQQRGLALAMCLLGVPVMALGVLPLSSRAADTELTTDPVVELVSSISELDTTEPRLFAPFLLEVTKDKPVPPVNVVFVILESTRASAVSVYSGVQTTPFLAQLAPTSLVVDRAYTSMPHTSKALIAILCGIEPAHTTEQLALKMGMLQRCLPTLLGEQGYRSVFFQSADPSFEARIPTTTSMGFNEFVAAGANPEGFERANFLGFEDEVMLQPSARWLSAYKDKPFLAVYMTVAPHHEVIPLHRHGFKQFDPEPEVNNYLNAVRSEDFFIRALVNQYKAEGVYDHTLFIILGDHGDAFGEHDRRAHDAVPYEEVLRIPLIFHDGSGAVLAPGRIAGPVSQLDMVPTLLELLGLRISKGKLAGISMLNRPPEKPVMAACFGDRECLVHLRGTRKLIHFFDKRPNELYDLATDPGERRPLGPQKDDVVQRRMAELLKWDQRVRALYWGEGLLAKPRR